MDEEKREKLKSEIENALIEARTKVGASNALQFLFPKANEAIGDLFFLEDRESVDQRFGIRHKDSATNYFKLDTTGVVLSKSILISLFDSDKLSAKSM